MNIYFLVEGRTEKKVYSKWLPYLQPELSQVRFADEVTKNNYLIVTGGGFPDILKTGIENAVIEVNESNKFNYLVLAIDSDYQTADEKLIEIESYIAPYQTKLTSNCQLKIIIQNCCLETWFLGNRDVYPENTDNIEFKHYADFFDVSQHDPESMPLPDSLDCSIASYHESYLKKMLKTNNQTYSKKMPSAVCTPNYIDALQNRVTETPHLSSLKSFFSFCSSLNS